MNKNHMKKPHKTPRKATEGVWYAVRGAGGWRLLAHPFRAGSQIEDHSAFWEQIVAPWLALEHKLSQKKLRELELHPYGFPRGRVTKIRGGFTVYHGDDWRPFIAKAEIERAFHLTKRAKWVLDDHETRIDWDRDQARGLLGISDEHQKQNP
jgi:hypothetical protein